MSDQIMWIVFLSVFTGLGIGYALGFSRGFNKCELTENGWMDEALWWRSNAVGIVPKEQRKNDEF